MLTEGVLLYSNTTARLNPTHTSTTKESNMQTVVTLNIGYSLDEGETAEAAATALADSVDELPSVDYAEAVTEAHVVLVGNPVAGLEVFGVFATEDDAETWADANKHDEAYWVVPLARDQP